MIHQTIAYIHTRARTRTYTQYCLFFFDDSFYFVLFFFFFFLMHLFLFIYIIFQFVEFSFGYKNIAYRHSTCTIIILYINMLCSVFYNLYFICNSLLIVQVAGPFFVEIFRHSLNLRHLRQLRHLRHLRHFSAQCID